MFNVSYICSNIASQRVYSSMLSFTIPDINSTVSKLMALGAELDGPIKYEIHGKVFRLYAHNSPIWLISSETSYDIIFTWNSYCLLTGCSLTMHRWAHARSLWASLKNSCHNESNEKLLQSLAYDWCWCECSFVPDKRSFDIISLLTEPDVFEVPGLLN